MATPITIQLRRMLDATRAGITPLAGECIWTTDLKELWIGDGSTAGGTGPFRQQAAVDHGGLAGLADDDHAQYLRGDGTRHATAAFYFDDLIGLAGIISQVGTSPDLSQFNSTPSDASGARSCRWLAGGATAAVGVHYLGTLEFEHDGGGADERGRLILSLNDGADGLTPTEVVRFQGVDALANFAGEVRTPVGRVCCVRNASTQTVTTTLGTLTLDTSVRVDTGFSLASSEVTVAFAGDILVRFDVCGAQLAGTRTGGEWWLERDSGGGYAQVVGTYRTSYHRASTTCGTASCSGFVLTVASGDKLRLRGYADTSLATISLFAGGVVLTLERLQAAS